MADEKECITVDRYGKMYVAAYYGTYTEEPDIVGYGPIAIKAIRKHQWRAWIDAVIWAIKERTLLSF